MLQKAVLVSDIVHESSVCEAYSNSGYSTHVQKEAVHFLEAALWLVILSKEKIILWHPTSSLKCWNQEEFCLNVLK